MRPARIILIRSTASPPMLALPLGCERSESRSATTQNAPADVPQQHRPIGIDRTNPDLQKSKTVPPPSNAPETKTLPTTSPTSGPAGVSTLPAAVPK